MSSSHVRLPIDVPPGWVATQHELSDLEPETLAPDAPEWWTHFPEDLLQIHHSSEDLQEIGLEPTGLILDVGWSPDGEASGSFVLVLIRDRDWANPLVRFTTRSLRELSERLHELLRPPARAPERPLEELIPLLSDTDAHVRMGAVKAIARCGEPGACDALISQLYEPEDGLPLHQLILKAFGWTRDASAVPLLMTWIEHPDPAQRGAAAWSLAAIGDPTTLHVLRRAFERERHPGARDAMRFPLYRLVQVNDRRPAV